MEISPFIRRIGRRMTMAWAGSNRRESRICSGARSRSGGALAGLGHNKRLNLPPPVTSGSVRLHIPSRSGR